MVEPLQSMPRTLYGIQRPSAHHSVTSEYLTKWTRPSVVRHASSQTTMIAYNLVGTLDSCSSFVPLIAAEDRCL